MAARLRSTHVFLNCPFDSTYKAVFDAIVFAVRDLGFVPRCALEVDDASLVRLDRISEIIAQCRYGIHDLSYVDMDPRTRLPRFNMPLELGLYLGCKRFGGRAQRAKSCLVLDRKPFRYRAFISDISGQDIHAYDGSPKAAIANVRNWLRTASGLSGLAGGVEIHARYQRFTRQLPMICSEVRLAVPELTFLDYAEITGIWLLRNR